VLLYANESKRTAELPESFEVEIVYGTNKLLGVTETETIQNVKLGALDLFGIARSEVNQFVLKTEIKGKEEQLNEAETVAFYKIHPRQKIKLASGTPYGKQITRARIKGKGS
jgi:hypothetical protein